jgi:acetyl-CoA acyltransferase
MSETLAKQRGYIPLGYLVDYSYAALEPERMGLGPVYATSKLLSKTGVPMSDIQLVEMNEAFAAQIIANERAFPSKEFARTFLGRDTAVGELKRDILNVNGGAIALGHPVGMTGTRLVIHLLKEMRRRKNNIGLATLCVGGGQGAALLLEVE